MDCILQHGKAAQEERWPSSLLAPLRCVSRVLRNAVDFQHMKQLRLPLPGTADEMSDFMTHVIPQLSSFHARAHNAEELMICLDSTSEGSGSELSVNDKKVRECFAAYNSAWRAARAALRTAGLHGSWTPGKKTGLAVEKGVKKIVVMAPTDRCALRILFALLAANPEGDDFAEKVTDLTVASSRKHKNRQELKGALVITRLRPNVRVLDLRMPSMFYDAKIMFYNDHLMRIMLPRLASALPGCTSLSVPDFGPTVSFDNMRSTINALGELRMIGNIIMSDGIYEDEDESDEDDDDVYALIEEVSGFGQVDVFTMFRRFPNVRVLRNGALKYDPWDYQFDDGPSQVEVSSMAERLSQVAGRAGSSDLTLIFNGIVSKIHANTLKGALRNLRTAQICNADTLNHDEVSRILECVPDLTHLLFDWPFDSIDATSIFDFTLTFGPRMTEHGQAEEELLRVIRHALSLLPHLEHLDLSTMDLSSVCMERFLLSIRESMAQTRHEKLSVKVFLINRHVTHHLQCNNE